MDTKEYKKAYYQANKKEIQLKKILKEAETKGRKISAKTLLKFGLKPNEKGEIIITPKPKIIFEKQVIPTKVIVEEPKNIQAKPPDHTYTKLTDKEYKIWVSNDLSKIPIKGQEKTRGNELLKQYNTIFKKLFTLQQLEYDENRNLEDWLLNADALVKILNKWNVGKATKALYLGKVLFVARNFPPLKNKIDKIQYITLSNTHISYAGSAKGAQRLKTQTTLFFDWNLMKKEILKEYTQVSYENLLFSMYDEVYARDDYGLLMAYSKDEMTNEMENYMLIERKTATMYLNSYKTGGTYEGKVFKMSKKIYDLIMKLHEGVKEERLFPSLPRKLSPYIIKTLRKIELFKTEPGLGTKYLRHSIISSKLMELDTTAKNYGDKVYEISVRSLHSTGMQTSYISPLKGANGKALYSDSEIRTRDGSVSQIVTRSMASK